MKKLQPIYALFITLFLLYAFSSNPPNGRTGAPGDGKCTDCHTINNSGFEGMVGVRGLPTVIMPNTTYNLSVVTKVSAGNPSRSGFQLVVLDGANGNAGTLENPGASSTTMASGGRTYFEHNPAQSFGTADSVTWTIDWTAPASVSGDSVIVYINSMIGNGAGSGGDLMVSNRIATAFQDSTVDPLSLSINSTDVSCFSGNDGIVTVSASGGTGNVSFAWSNDSTGATISNLGIGNYIVTATDEAGSAVTASATISQPSELTISIAEQTNIDCDNPMGFATVLAAGGTLDYTYVWSTGDSSDMASLPMGMHTVTVTDVNACTASIMVIISEDARAPLADAGFDVTINCNSPNTTIQLDGRNSSTGTGVQYLWTSSDGHILIGDSTLMPTVDSAGTYILTVTNTANACTTSDTVVVIHDLTPPQADAGAAAQLDCGTPSLTLNGVETVGDNIVYLWTTLDGNITSGDSTLNPVVSSAGTYTLTVTNLENACSANASVSVTQDANLPDADAGENKQLDCNNSTVTLDGSGSTGDSIAYLWTTTNGNILSGDSTLMPTVGEAGVYTLVVTNTNNACFATDTVVVVLDANVPMADAGTDGQLDCVNDTLVLNGAGSVGDHIIYEWTTADGNIISGASTLAATIDQAGTYTLTVSDTSNACSIASSVTIIENRTIPIADAGTNAQIGCDNATINLNGNGSSSGTNIHYQWITEDGNIVFGGNTTTPLIDVAGTYTLTVSDTSNGCSATASVVVTALISSDIFAASGDADQLTCNRSVITLSGNGSTGEHIVYEWTTEDGNILEGANTLSPSINAPGKYTLIVRDTLTGCFAESFVNISQDAAMPGANITGNQVLDCNTSSITLNGSAEVTFHLRYQWTTEDGNIVSGTNDQNALINASGTYLFTVTDTINGCSSTASIVVEQDDALPSINAGPTMQLDCNTDTLILNGSGSMGDNFTQLWTTTDGNIIEGANTFNPVVNAPGRYTLTITDTSSACASIASVEVIMDVQKPIADAGAEQQMICANSTITLSGSENIGDNFTYFWCTPDGSIVSGAETPMAIIDGAGLFEYIVTNTNNGCMSVDTIMVTEIAELVLTLDSTSAGSASVSTSGGTAPYAYNWNTDPVQMEATVKGLVAGDYSLTVTDANGCTDTLTVTIEMSTSVADLDKALESLQIYPNPASTYFEIDIAFKRSQNGAVSILNAIGQHQWQQTFKGEKLFYKIDINDWLSGIYYLFIKTEEGIKTEEIVIVR